LIRDMAGTLPPHRRVSLGFPGVVKRGVAQNAPNLGNELWHGVSLNQQLGQLLQRPVRAINDADLQGLGVVRGEGVELVLTLGTGMGAALFTEGVLVPNLELGHHPLRDGMTYEDLVRDTELKRLGPARWTARVLEAIGQIEPLFNYDTLYLGGGNVRNLQSTLPANVRVFTLAEALRGALKLWDDA
jgi:polyphosphate glucokinase